MYKKLIEILTSKRLMSLYWRLGMMFSAGIIEAVIDAASSLSLPGWAIVGLGLILGEISKKLNTKKVIK